MDLTNIDKAKMYAIALPVDISAKRFEVVENGKIWRGWVGTVYGICVMTQERGHKFCAFEEARSNAELFVEQCKRIAWRAAP